MLSQTRMTLTSKMGDAASQLLSNPIIKNASVIDWGKMMAHANEFIQRDLLRNIGFSAYHPSDSSETVCAGFTSEQIANLSNTIKNNSPGADIFVKTQNGQLLRIQSKLRQVKGITDFSQQTHFETTRRNSKKNQNQNQSGHIAYDPSEFDWVFVTLCNVRENLSRRNDIRQWSFSCVPVQELINPQYGCCATKISSDLLLKYKVNFNDPDLLDKLFKPFEPPELTTTEKQALKNYETFHGFLPGTAQIHDIINSSAGIEGWASFDPTSNNNS